MIERVAIAPEAADASVRAAIVERAHRRGFTRFVLDAADRGLAAADDELSLQEGDGLRVGGDGPLVPRREVGSVAELDRAVAATPDGGILLLAWRGDRVIPLENAVARRGRRFRLWTVARRPAELAAALGALEHGADRVVVQVRSVGEVDELESAVGGAVPSGLDWVTVPLQEVRPTGVGDRVLVDTTSLLAPEEGMLVGSAAAFLFHVASEAAGSTFSRPRPFRVNAGSAHSYVLMADGTTRYLAELGPGDGVLAVRPDGSARTVRVGRLKVERRPLVLVGATVDGVVRTVFLQEAETVRLSGPTGRRPTTGLVPGEKVVGVRLPPGRHLGTAVEETVEER